MQWKEGDWCFYEFRLSKIEKVEDGKIKEVTDGFSSTAGSDLSGFCFPVQIYIKRISDRIACLYDDLIGSIHIGLNWPDIHRKSVEFWYIACTSNSLDAAEIIIGEYRKFATQIKQVVKNLDTTQCDGVYIFRRSDAKNRD